MLQGLNRRFGNGLRLQAVQQAGQVGDGFTIQGANKGVKMLVIRSLYPAEPVRPQARLNALIAAPQGRARRRLATGLQRALGAQQGDPFIVPVAGAAGIVQLRQRAAAHLHHQDGGVDIAKFGNVRQGQRRAHRCYGAHFIASEKAQEIEEVDRLIAHLAAGAAQIVERRHAGGAADHLHQLDPADKPLLQLAAELLMAAIEAPVKADSDRHVQGEHPLHHLTGARQGEVDRFFAIDRLARPGGGFQQFGMRRG